MTNDCSVQTERHLNIPVLQTESSEKVRQQNRVIQTVPVKDLSSHSSRETSQSSKYEVTNKYKKSCSDNYGI